MATASAAELARRACACTALEPLCLWVWCDSLNLNWEESSALEAKMVEERAGVLWRWEQEEAEPVAKMLFHSSVVGFAGDCQGVAEPILSYCLSGISVGAEVSWLEAAVPAARRQSAGSALSAKCLLGRCLQKQDCLSPSSCQWKWKENKTCGVLYFSPLFDKASSKIKYSASQ